MSKESIISTVEAAMTEPWDNPERKQITLSEVIVLSVIQSIRDRAWGDLDLASDEQRREIVSHAASCVDYVMELAATRGDEMIKEPAEPSLIVVPQMHIQGVR